MRVKIVIAGREPLSCPLEARERIVGVERHIKLVASGRVGADRRIAIQVLSNEGPVFAGFETGAKTGKACPPGINTGRGLGTGVAAVVVAQRTHFQSIVMPPDQSAIVAGLSVDFVVEVKRRFAEIAE